MMLSLEEVAVDVDTLMPSLGVKSFLLLDVDSQQSAATGCYRHYQGRNRSEEHIETVSNKPPFSQTNTPQVCYLKPFVT